MMELHWQDDLSRSNHFLYDEKIHSAYSSIDEEKGKWHWQAGLRYEFTSYKAINWVIQLLKILPSKKTMEVYSLSGFVSYQC